PGSEVAEVVRTAGDVGAVQDPCAVGRDRLRRGKRRSDRIEDAGGIDLVDFAVADVGNVEDVAAVDGHVGRALDESGAGGNGCRNRGDLRWRKGDYRGIPVPRQAKARRRG